MGRRRGLSRMRGNNSLTTDIIPGLPNEVAVMILARVPRALHASLRCVCCAWRNALQPLAMSALRNTLQISEIWTLFFLADSSIALYDPLLQHLSSPTPFFWDYPSVVRVLGAVGSQVFFLHQPPWADSSSVCIRCFDAASMQWQSDSIPLWSNTFMLGCAIAVVDDHLCVVGGGEDGREVRRFDVKSRVWETMPNMHESCVWAAAAVLQGCLHVIGGGKSSDNQTQSGKIWDPRMGEWMLEQKLSPAQLSYSQPQVAVVMDTLYALRGAETIYCHTNELELVYYVSESKLWTSLGHLPLEKYACRCGKCKHCWLVGAGKELWVVLTCHDYIVERFCTVKILSCVPTIGPSPLSWRSVPVPSSIKLTPGYNVRVLGNVHV